MSRLGDITESTFFEVQNSPYVAHERDFLKPQHFRVPKAASPYAQNKKNFPTEQNLPSVFPGLSGDDGLAFRAYSTAWAAGWGYLTYELHKRKSKWKYVTGLGALLSAAGAVSGKPINKIGQ